MMKRIQSLFAVAALLSAVYVSADNSRPKGGPYFGIRSQGVNAARDLIGWQEFINQCDMGEFYGAMAITAEYNQTFQGYRIADSIFGSDVTNGVANSCCSTTTCNTGCNSCGSSSCNGNCGGCCTANLQISGSRAASRGTNDWLADYFGLPTDFQSTVSFNPKIQNAVADIHFYFGFDEWAEGLYFRLDLPIAWTRWNLNYKECIGNAGSCAYSAGYFTDQAVAASSLLTNATDFFSGSKAPALGTLVNGTAVTFDKLTASKWHSNACGTSSCGACCESCGLSKTRLADVAMVLGYNFVCSDDYHFGLLARATAPTGNAPCGEFLFEPIVGNGKHWELGAGVTGHAVLWRSDCSDSTFDLYLDANVTHLFAAQQCRVFDLCKQGVNSRYMLAYKLTPQINGLLGGGAGTSGVASTYQFANEYAPVANLTRKAVRVTIPVQGDLALKFSFNNGNGFSWDLGYNFWATSCEDICLKTCTPCGTSADPLDGKTWALKGDAMIFGFLDGTNPGSVALAPSESGATIHNGTNGFGPGCSDITTANAAAILNPNIDNAQAAFVGSVNVVSSDVATGTVNQTHTSIQTTTLKNSDLYLTGTQGMTHKVFTHLSYAWIDHEDWQPFLGVGAAAEFSADGCNSCKTDCNTGCSTTNCNTNCDTSCSTSCNTDCCSSCYRSNMNSWGVWIKGGVAFN